MREKGKTAVIALLAVLLAACVSLSVLFLPVQAATVESFSYNFAESGIDGTNFMVYNDANQVITADANGVTFRNDFGVGNGARVIGTRKFAINEEDPSNIVFDVTFSAYNGDWQVEYPLYVGLSCGLPEPTSELFQGTFIGTGKRYSTIALKGGNQDAEYAEKYQNYTDAYATDVATQATFRVVGYEDKKIEVYRDAPGGTDSIETLVATYTDCEVEGYIALGIYNFSGASAAGGYSYEMTVSNFTVSGQIEVEEVEPLPEVTVSIDEAQFANVSVGDKDFQATASVTGGEGVDTSVTWSVISGNATITADGKLTVTDSGAITLRATSAVNPACYDEVTFTPRPAVVVEGNTLIYDYTFADSGVDGLNFRVLNNGGEGSPNITVLSNGVVFANDYAAGTARVANSFNFVASDSSDVVFDITFSGYYGAGQVRDVNIYTGLAFGLPAADADFSEGTFVGIGIPNTTVIQKGEQTESHRYDEGYAEGYNERITLRIVAEKDGTVTLYRGFTMPGGNESIETVLATYENVDVDGYIAFGVYNYASGFDTPYTFTMTDFSVNGRLTADTEAQIAVNMDEAQFNHAFVGMPAFNVKATVSVAPAGVEEDTALTYSVQGGNATITPEGLLTINGSGAITVRAALMSEPSVYDEVTFTPDVPQTAEETLDYSYSFSESGVDGINFGYEKDNGNFTASGSGVVIANEVGAGTGARLASRYAFLPKEGGAGTDIVFDLTFSGYFEMDKVRWINIFAGFAFGLPEPDSDFSEGTFIGMSSLFSTVIKNGEQIDDHEPTFPIFAEYYNERVTIRIVGQADGTVTVYRGYTMPGGDESIEDVLATYTGCRVDGYVAFGVYNMSDFSGEYSYTMTDFSVNGTISSDVTPNVTIEIEEAEFPYAYVGMPALQLTAKVDVAPGGGSFSDALVYTVESGNATITEDGLLTINGEGEITIRATSVANQECYDEVKFTPLAAGTYACESYTVEDEFYSFDEGIWTLTDPYERTNFGAGFDIRGDYTEDGYNGVKLVSNVRFSGLGDDRVVFDMTVRSYGHQRYNYDDRWGFAFGLPEKTSDVNDEGVGFLWMSTIGMGLTVGGREITPDYVRPYNNGGTIRYLDSAVYVDTYNEAFVIRLVAYKDGTLELYRTQAGHESLDELKARWTGLDFNGYVALATSSPYNATYTETSGANFREFSITGTALDDGSAEVTQLRIDRDVFLRVAQVEPALELKAFVSAAPSFDKYKEVLWEVVSGPATITDGYITFSAPGEVTIRATAKEDPTKTDTYTFTVENFYVNSVSIIESLFEGVTDFTQPIELEKAAELDCSLATPKYNVVDWEVVSGPAEVQAGRLRILGTGEVTVRAYARYDTSKTDEITFRVTSYYDDGAALPTYAIVLIAVGAAIVVAAAVTAGVLVAKRKKKAVAAADEPKDEE